MKSNYLLRFVALACAGRAIFLIGLLAASAGTSTAESENGTEAPGRYIVRLKEGAVADEVARAHGLGVEHEYSAAIRGFSGVGDPGKLEEVRGDERVESVEPDVFVAVESQTLPTGVNRIDADLSGTAGIDGKGERVKADIGIIDTGVDSRHPDLRVIDGYNCTSKERGWWKDEHGHGTHVAGIAAALDNDYGVVGVAPGARISAVRVLGSTGSGYLSWVICGVDWVTANANKIDVANMSLSGRFTSAAFNAAIANSVAKGVTYAVAAGNSSSNAMYFSPASHPDVITVSSIADTDGRCGALGPNYVFGGDDTFARGSNYGSVVDMAAPGVGILSTWKGGGYALLSGTSMASPTVAGAAALYVATHGRDVNNNKVVDGADVAEIRAGLTAAAVAQNQTCNPADDNGWGGFTGDPDGIAEPLVYAGAL